MEARRIEGVFLDYAIDRSKAAEAYKTSQSIAIRIRTQVPEVLLSLVGDTGSQLRAVVKEATGGQVLLALDNGYEILADNRLGIAVNSGDRVVLRVEDKQPLTLRLESLAGGLKGTEVVKSLLGAEKVVAELTGSVRESLQNSGVVYEKKVVDLLLGKIGFQELSQDQKFQVLKALEGLDLKRFVENLESTLPRGDTNLRNMVASLENALSKKDYAAFLSVLKEIRGYTEQKLSQVQAQLQSLPKEVSVLNALLENPAQNLPKLIQSLPPAQRHALENALALLTRPENAPEGPEGLVRVLERVLPQAASSEKDLAGPVDRPKPQQTQVAAERITAQVQRGAGREVKEAYPQPIVKGEPQLPPKVEQALREVVKDSAKVLFSDEKLPPPKAVVDNLIRNLKVVADNLPREEGFKESLLSQLRLLQNSESQPQAFRENLLNLVSSLNGHFKKELPPVLARVLPLLTEGAALPSKEVKQVLREVLTQVFDRPQAQSGERLVKLSQEVEATKTLREALVGLREALEQGARERIAPQGGEDMLRSAINEVLKHKREEGARLEREMGELAKTREFIDTLPKEAVKNMEKLDLIYQLQSFIVNTRGSKFFIPFMIKEDWKGVLALSKREELYRIFININMPEGFLGILMESPKEEFPEFVRVLFRTDVPQIESLINLRKDSLRRDLEELGLKVKGISVEGATKEEFDKEMVSEFGQSVFYMKV